MWSRARAGSAHSGWRLRSCGRTSSRARGVVAVILARPGKAPERVASLHAGEFFGEMALLTQEPRTATVQAVTGCHLYELSSNDVDGLCEICPGVREALTHAYEERRKSARRSSIIS